MSDSNKSNRKRRRRHRLKFAFWTLLVSAVAAVAMYFHKYDIHARDQHLVSATRAKNVAMHQVQQPLLGTPDLARLDERLDAHGVELGAPVFMRLFKREFELELWMKRDGRFHRFATYPICKWSGKLGPKYKEGDHQAPEGFYTVSKKQLNPNSRWHRSFNLGYPNAFDRSYGRTGSFLMVHGGCGSVGCYAMTDPVITEIWKIVTAALNAGQKRFHVHVFPFRMSEGMLEARKDHRQIAFWTSLKQGHDLFEHNWLPPRVHVCNRQYTFSAAQSTDGSDPIQKQCVTEDGPTT